MKRLLSALLTTVLILGALPARTSAWQGDGPAPLEQVSLDEIEQAGLSVTWYPQYKSITRLYGIDRMVAPGENGLYALLTLEGQPVTDFLYDAVRGAENGRIYACKEGKWGAIDHWGNVLVDFIYESEHGAKDKIEAEGEAYFVGRFPGQPPYALARPDGTLLTEYKYWDYHGFKNGFAMVTDGGEGWGYLRADGVEITALKYADLVRDERMGSGSFTADGLAAVSYYGHNYNIIDAAGRELLPRGSWRKPWPAGFGLWGYEDPDTHLVGFVDGMGRVVIAPQYDVHTTPKGELEGCVFASRPTVYTLYDPEKGATYYEGMGLAKVYHGVAPLFIDTQGNAVKPREVEAPEENIEGYPCFEGLCPVNEAGRLGDGGGEDGPWGFADKEGKAVIPALFDAVGDFDYGYASVRLGGVYGLLKNPLRANDRSHWAAEELDKAADLDLVTEDCVHYQTYAITRAQFAHLAVNYLEKTFGEGIPPAGADTFTDTTDEGILKAYVVGIVQGVGEGRFDPDAPLTREQLATMLWRAMEKAGAGTILGSMDGYTDWEQVADWAKSPVDQLVQHGIMQGTSATTLSPGDSCTVEQAILLILRAYEKDFAIPPERETQRQAALDRVTVRGLPIGTPLDELPGELRSALVPVGQPYDGWPTEPGKEIAQRYEAPGITVITSRAAEDILRRQVEGNEYDYLIELFDTADRAAILERELGREYVDTVILTSADYELASGLKVGDSEERAMELGYGLGPFGRLDGETAGFDGSTEITWEGDQVSQIEVWDFIGRRVGPFFDP